MRRLCLPNASKLAVTKNSAYLYSLLSQGSVLYAPNKRPWEIFFWNLALAAIALYCSGWGEHHGLWSEVTSFSVFCSITSCWWMAVLHVVWFPHLLIYEQEADLRGLFISPTVFNNSLFYVSLRNKGKRGKLSTNTYYRGHFIRGLMNT